MTKEEFVLLQHQHQQSGKSLKEFLKDAGICYSKYNYWNRKCKSDVAPRELAPIVFADTKEHIPAASSFIGGLLIFVYRIMKYKGVDHVVHPLVYTCL